MAWCLITIGGMSFLLLATNALWFRWWYRHQAKCLWYKDKQQDVMEIREVLWALNTRGYGMVEIHRVNTENLYRVRP